MDALNLLLECGANPLSRNRSGLTMYDHIVSTDHVDLLEIFWNEAWAYDKARNVKEFGGCGLVHRAAGGMGPECLDYILARNPGNEKNLVMQYNNEFEKSLPLHYAVLGANTRNVKTLLRYMKSKPLPQQPKGRKDAQTVAFQRYKDQQYGELVKTGVDAQEISGCSALHLASLLSCAGED